MNPFQNLWGEPEIGEGTKIGAFVDIGKGVKIGKNCIIQAFVSIPPGVTIEDNVFIGPHVGFANHKNISDRGHWRLDETYVGSGASIGMGAMIGPGLKIGNNAVIGMGSIVTKHIPSGETWIGNPAHKYDQCL